MARGSCTFRQRDLTAAVTAVRKAGCSVARVEVSTRDGSFVVVIGKAAEQTEPREAEGKNPWDTIG